jgi:RNA polymerase sigma-70 factor (sigma-E family)
VTALYQAHALGLVRLAYVMLGDRAAAEDVVQEAFYGLYRRWAQLTDPGKALPYLRSSVLNGCRSVLRKNASLSRPRAVRGWPGAALDQRSAIHDLDGADQSAASGEAAVLSGEERRAVMDALRRLPDRQREALVLRFYFDQPDSEIARVMGVARGTVRSTTHRALAALGRLLGDLP